MRSCTRWKGRCSKLGNGAENANQEKLWTPSNVITIIRILLVPVFVGALLAPWPEWIGLSSTFTNNWKSIIAAIIFVVISGTDWLDGYLARSRNEVTDFGKFMDPLADKILVAAALISLVELGALPTWVVLVILAREFIVSGLRMMAASKGVVIAASMIGKFKTVFQMIAIVLFTIKDSHMVGTLGAAMSDTLWVVSWVVMLIAIGLTIASMIDYLYKSRELLGFGGESHDASDDDVTGGLASALVHAAREQNLTLATAESLTGGMIGSAITAIPGSSDVFLGGVTSYASAVKHDVLSVGSDVLADQGAVSRECAMQMADGARTLIGSDIAVSVTGIAGPGGEEPGKPVGTVWMGVSTSNGCDAERFQFEGNRDDVRKQTVDAALSALLKEIG